MPKISMQIPNLSSVLDSFDRADYKVREAAESAMYESAQILKSESQRIVPYDTGLLHSSAGIDAYYQGEELQVSVFYDTYYAVWVHEDPFAYHKPPTRYKFLEEPARRLRPVFQNLIRKRINDALEESAAEKKSLMEQYTTPAQPKIISRLFSGFKKVGSFVSRLFGRRG